LTKAPAYLSDSLRPTSEIVARRCLRSSDTTTLQVPSTRRATIGDRAFPVATSRAWNSLLLETLACSSLLTFRRETKSHLFRLTWRRLLRWSADVCIELCNSFRSRFCKVPPQLCDGSTVIHDILVVVVVVVVNVVCNNRLIASPTFYNSASTRTSIC